MAYQLDVSVVDVDTVQSVTANVHTPRVQSRRARFWQNGAIVGELIPIATIDGVCRTSDLRAPGSGTYTLRVYASDGVTLLSESTPFTVPPEWDRG